MTALSQRQCVPSHRGTPLLDARAARTLLAQVPAWELRNSNRLCCSLEFSDFASALVFVNRVAELAEQQQHHPEITIAFSRVTLTLWTQDAGGLTDSDFILAAKIDALRERAKLTA